MTNEMGNQNTNGFLASERENNESAYLTSQSSLNASSMSNELDGLKSLTGSLSHSSPNLDKPESPKLANRGYLEPTVETTQSISSGENEEEEHSQKVVTDEPLKSSVVQNDVLNEGPSILSRENEAYEKQDANMVPADEDLDSKIMSNEHHAGFARNESSEVDGSLIIRETSETTEEENNEAPEIIKEHPKAFSTSSCVDDLKYSTHSLPYDHQASEEHKAEKSDTGECFKHVGFSNDTGLTLPTEFEAVHKQTPSEDNESLEKDDVLIHNQTHEARVEEKTNTLAQESTEEADEFVDSIVERQNQSLPANINQENKIDDLPVEGSNSIGDMVPVINSIQVIEDHIDQDRERKCEELEAGQSVAYLDAVDSEIEKLIMEDFANGDKEASTAESNKLLEELKMDDIDTDSFEIQLNAVEPKGEEKDDGNDARLEEAVFEISLQTDYTSNLMPEILSKNIEVETAPVIESAIVSDISVADNKHEEATEYEELGDQKKEQIFQTTPTEIIRPASAQYLEEFENKCILNENETPKTNEFSIVNNNNALLAEAKSETKIQLQEKITKNNEEVSRELSQEKPFETEVTETEKVKCLIYTSERSNLDADESSPNYVRDQIPSMGQEKATKGEVFTSETSDTEEIVREYLVSTNQESDKSPLLDRKPEESEDFGNLRTQLGNIMKEEPALKNDGSLFSKRTVEAKKSMASLDKAREKQKRKSSLFHNFMCCTTAIN
ncbi:uncharacterized protein LOC109833022 isoform X1 [Asparagus officinalis]|nr:uncharacterized protein LOC109833022 isoform X1 [Asparagus officinalis]